MKIQLAKKSIGKRRPVYEEYVIEEPIRTLRDFIRVVVTQEVNEFNKPSDGPKVLPKEAIWVNAEVGKVGFGEKYNDAKQDVDKAIDVALLGFEDGLFKVFVDDDEIESLDSVMELTDKSRVTLIRLTFLSGRLW